MSLDAQVKADNEDKRLGKERRLVDITRKGMHSRARELQEQVCVCVCVCVGVRACVCVCVCSR
jgi:hypothetical protein